MYKIIIIIIIIIIIPCESFRPTSADGLSLESEWQKVPSRTLLSILADLIISIVWMVSARPPISNSSSLLSKPLRSKNLHAISLKWFYLDLLRIFENMQNEKFL